MLTICPENLGRLEAKGAYLPGEIFSRKLITNAKCHKAYPSFMKGI